MKALLQCLSAIALLLVMAACGGGDEGEMIDQDTTTVETAPIAPEPIAPMDTTMVDTTMTDTTGVQ